MQSPPPLSRSLARSISDGSIQSHSSMGDTSRASGLKYARGRGRRPEDTRSGWLSQASGNSEEPEEKVHSTTVCEELLMDTHKACCLPVAGLTLLLSARLWKAIACHLRVPRGSTRYSICDTHNSKAYQRMIVNFATTTATMWMCAGD